MSMTPVEFVDFTVYVERSMSVVFCLDLCMGLAMGQLEIFVLLGFLSFFFISFCLSVFLQRVVLYNSGWLTL